MVSGNTVTRFTTCQCPTKAQGKPGAHDYMAARKREERRDGGGKLIAVTCGRCMLPISLFCRACGSEVPDIDEHMSRADSCGLADKQWRAARARTGSPRVTKATMARTGKLFPDDVLIGPSRGKAIHK